MNNIVTQRFVVCHDALRESKRVRSSRQFAMDLDYLPQSLSEILKGRRDVTIDVIRKAVEVYQMNPIFLFTGQGDMFLSSEPPKHLAPTEHHILHVPAAAQAAYVAAPHDADFLAELPTMMLPDYKYRVGLHRSFDISGNAMEPTLFEGDKVVCSHLEREHWQTGIKNNYVYVIVTQSDVLIRRLNSVNLVPTEGGGETLVLEAVADNPLYSTLYLKAENITQIWYVRLRISPFLPSPSRVERLFLDEVQQLKQVISSQTTKIDTLSKIMSKSLD